MTDGQKMALDAQAKQIQELKDTNTSLKTDIQRVKASLSGEPKLQSRVAELESMLDGVEHEKKQLNVRTTRERFAGLLASSPDLPSFSMLRIHCTCTYTPS